MRRLALSCYSLACVALSLLPIGAIGAETVKPARPDQELPFGLYSVITRDQLEQVASDGFTFVLPYSFSDGSEVADPKFSLLPVDEYLSAATELGLQVVFPLLPIGEGKPGRPEATEEVIAKYSADKNILWWYLLPEERRFWYENEFSSLKQQSQAVKKYDPEQRPAYMYIATNYGTSDLVAYLPYSQVIGAGAYANYALKPRCWIRWRIEQQLQAIEQDPQHGSISIAVLQMFPPESPTEIKASGDQAYHDSYLSLISGAKALLVHTYNPAYRDKIDSSVYQGYAKAAREINGPEQIGAAILADNVVKEVAHEIVSGPKNSPTFNESFNDVPGKEVTYPSIHCRALRHAGRLIILATNSAPEPVTVDFKSLPADVSTEVELPFESRQIACADGKFRDDFAAESVHVYILPLNDGGDPR